MPTRESRNTWLGFVLDVVGDAPQAEIATRTGLNQATVSRWLSGRRSVTAESAILFARGYQVNPITALVAAGYLTAEEADLPRAWLLDQVPTSRLIGELARRDRVTEAAS